MRIVIAVGGNALLRRGERPDAAVQLDHIREVMPALARVAGEHQVVIVHGNGPQVGLLAVESGSDAALSAPYPLDGLVAETQGMIGYWLQQAIGNLSGRPTVTLVTQTVVADEDPAFANPEKFIGVQYDEATARRLAATSGWVVKPDGDCWRRVVASPYPIEIVEIDVARGLLEAGTTVVLAGGGGVPVIRRDGHLYGVEAVVDKDHAAALVAVDLQADLFVVLTDVEAVMEGFGTPQQRPVGRVRVNALGRRDLPAGSMGPKVEAVRGFVRTTGRRAAIGALEQAVEVIAGTAGTQVIPGD